SQPITATPSGASGRSTCQRWTRRGPPSNHSNVTRPSPGPGGPPGGVASIVHSPSSASRRLRAAVSVDSLIASGSDVHLHLDLALVARRAGAGSVVAGHLVQHLAALLHVLLGVEEDDRDRRPLI